MGWIFLSAIITEKPELNILYHDQYFVAIDKPSGLFVHRSFLDKDEKYFALQLIRDQIGQYVYPVHRLDKPTSGVLLFALNENIARAMNQVFKDKKIQKTYFAISRGHLLGEGCIDYPIKIKLDKIGDKYASKEQEAKEAITAYKSIATATLPFAVGKYPTVRYSLLKLLPETGRRHQIRRHLAHLRHPIIGDVNYGDNKQNPFFFQHFALKRLMLHAYSLSFQHPVTEEQITIEAKFDQQWLAIFNQLGWSDFL
ncbi:tRNA pseudouridine(65) synthase TruC [Thalassotalea sediminis]|uniref:tRNA pseudouridine(65) synthase TruC n=1 Tax=Thalassotalea sediminis TaxID=1759089 RepID=UPI002572CC6D|nr:tRNA pseudouridine(65) synthase TruC [Thalassotalea sediminis]